MTVASTWRNPFLLDQICGDRAQQVAQLSDEPNRRVAYLIDAAKHAASIRRERARPILQLAKSEAVQIANLHDRIAFFLQIIKLEAEIDPAGVKESIQLALKALSKIPPDRAFDFILLLAQEALRYVPDEAEPLLHLQKRSLHSYEKKKLHN